jgi:uncharacterized RmlC-like cupin family protein
MQAQAPEFSFITFADGIARVAAARKQIGLEKRSNAVLTSRDPSSQRLVETLKVSRVPKGFTKWQLPFAFEGTGAQFFVSVAEPGAIVEEHFHEEGDGVRFIVGGSITYAGQELTAGDWMFIPEKVPYSFNVGRMGAIMCYCYACCCVPK